MPCFIALAIIFSLHISILGSSQYVCHFFHLQPRRQAVQHLLSWSSSTPISFKHSGGNVVLHLFPSHNMPKKCRLSFPYPIFERPLCDRLLQNLLICFLYCPWNSKHSSEKSHFYGFQFILNLFVYTPCHASIHEYRFDIALQGSLPCVYRQLGIRQDGLHFSEARLHLPYPW